MATMTITEALAEIKLIDKKVESKKAAIKPYIARLDSMRDPLESSGGSSSFVRAELQSIGDLLSRKVLIRSSISAANASSLVTVEGDTRSVADWLVWRREVAPAIQLLQKELRATVEGARALCQRNGTTIVNPGEGTRNNDVVINVDEKKLIKEMEKLESILTVLDGKLDLNNALVTVTLP